MIFRKIVVTAAIACLVLAFTACGDDDSSSFVEPEKESSDSSSGSVSSSSTNSSSSAKSSSSTDAKSSSSVTSSSSGTSAGSSAGNSSSSKAEDLSCTPEEEGQTFEFTLTGKKYICKNGSLIEIASSSSAAPTSSYFDMTNQFNEKVSYGEFTDPRDGQKYRTMELKNGVIMESYTVFAENLNYGMMVSGGSVQGDSTKYCYDDDPWYCENGFGGLYTWSTAMGFPTVCDSVSVASEKCPNKFNLESDNEEFNGKYYFVQHQGISPEGWHIMNENEWVEISEQSSRSSMSSKVAGFGTNSYGLSILPAGLWSPEKKEFRVMKEGSFYWMPQQYPEYNDCAHRAAIWENEFDRLSRGLKTQAFSIRCVKNY